MRIAGPLLEKRPSECSGRKRREGRHHTDRLRSGEPKAERHQHQERPAPEENGDESLTQAAVGRPHPSSEGQGSRVVGAPSRTRLKPSAPRKNPALTGAPP